MRPKASTPSTTSAAGRSTSPSCSLTRGVFEVLATSGDSGAWRRRLRSSRVLLAARDGRPRRPLGAGGCAPPAGQVPRGEGDAHRPRRRADRRDALRRRERQRDADRRDLRRDHAHAGAEDAPAGAPGAARRTLSDRRHQGRGAGRRRHAHAADPPRGRPSSSASRRCSTSIRTRSSRWARPCRPNMLAGNRDAAPTTGCCSTSFRCRWASRRWAASPRRSSRATRRFRSRGARSSPPSRTARPRWRSTSCRASARRWPIAARSRASSCAASRRWPPAPRASR